MPNYFSAQLNTTTPALTQEGEDEHTLSSEMCAVSRPLFSHCGLTMQPPKSYRVGGQCSSEQLTGKSAGARPDYRDRWCTVSRGHPGRPNPPSPRATLGQLYAAPWKLPSSVGKGIAWTQTRGVQTIGHILHSTRSTFTGCATREPKKHFLRQRVQAPNLPEQPRNRGRVLQMTYLLF
ncbi:UNVERIFIED_CONTAM: hypothetical protein FKN15_015886 [Acipenser sinensis]